MSGSVSFQGAACDRHLIFESYVLNGVWEVRLSAGTGPITFDGTPFRIKGVVDTLEPTGDCP
jgi:hypothetical protein